MARRWERTSEKSPEVVEVDKKQLIEDSEDIDPEDPELCQAFALNALEGLFGYEGVVDDYDFNTTVFCLFIECIHILSSCDWKADELKTEVDNHIDCNEEEDE